MSLVDVGFFAPLPSCWGFSFVFGCGVIFMVGSNILLLMALHQWIALLESSQKKMSVSPSTLPSLYQGYFKSINFLSSFKFIGMMFLCEPVKINANCSIFEDFLQLECLRHEVIYSWGEKIVLETLCIVDKNHRSKKNANIVSLGLWNSMCFGELTHLTSWWQRNFT